VLAWVSLADTELAIVISRPSRIQAVPSPSTRRVWNGDQRSLSSRAGMVLRIGCCCPCFTATVVIADFPFSPVHSRSTALAESDGWGWGTPPNARGPQPGERAWCAHGYGSGTMPCAPRGNLARVSWGMFRCAETSLGGRWLSQLASETSS
jgi:hypothetical protein